MEIFKEAMSEVTDFGKQIKKFDQDINYSLQQFEQRFSDQEAENKNFMEMFKRVDEENSVMRRLINSNTSVLEVRER